MVMAMLVLVVVLMAKGGDIVVAVFNCNSYTSVLKQES